MATLLILCWCLLLWCFLVYRNAYVQIIYFLPKLFDIWLWVYIFSCILITNLCLRCTFILVLVSLWVTADYRDMHQTCFFISTVWCLQLPIPLLMDNPINCTKYIWAEKLEMVSPCRWYDLQPRTTLQSLFEVLEGFSLKLWIVQVQPCVPCLKNPKSFSIIGWSRCLPCRSWAFQDLSSG